MKIKNLETFVISLTLFCALNSCRNVDTSPHSQKNEVNTVVLKWYNNFIKSKFDKEQSLAKKIINVLDYSDIAIIKQPHNHTVYLIHKQSLENKNEYFALQQNEQGIQLMGIYDAQDLNQITQFLKTKKLPKNEKLTINSISGKPLVQWETKANNQSVIRMVQDNRFLTSNLPLQKLTSASSIKGTSQPMKSNYIQDPEPGCTNWYWIEYDTATGMINSIEYLYTTCNEESGGGGGQASNVQLACEELKEEEIDATYSTSELSSISQTSATSITRTRAYSWKIYSGLTWQIKSHEIGKHEYSNTSNKWEWVSLTHSNTSISGFWFGGNISCSINSAVSSIYNQYAGMALNYNVAFTFTCDDKPCVRMKDANSSILIEVNQSSN